MSAHPTISVPGLGELDHAWDLLGAWRASLSVAARAELIDCSLDVTSWQLVTLIVDADAAREIGWPPQQPLARVSPVVRSDDGGGALAFTMQGALVGQLQLTLWPGELQVRSLPGAALEITLTARRDRSYYLAKYPAGGS